LISRSDLFRAFDLLGFDLPGFSGIRYSVLLEKFELLLNLRDFSTKRVEFLLEAVILFANFRMLLLQFCEFCFELA